METNRNSTKDNQNHIHAIFLPLQLQGHINPAVHLSLNLASRGFTITFLTLESLHQQLTDAHGGSGDIFEGVRMGSGRVDIRYRVISDGLPLDFDRTGELEEHLAWFVHGGMRNHIEMAVREIIELRSQPPVSVLIADTFYPWASKIARKFDLRYVSFWTEPALVFNLYYHVHLFRQHGHFDSPDNRKDAIDYIPGVRSIEPKDLMSYLQESDSSTNMHHLIFEAFQDVRSADYVLCNTIKDLESDTILTLQELMPFYPIGPIFLSGHTKSTVPTSLWAESNCSEWLDPKPHGSVLYVSFGSLANFTKDEVIEFAYGLMLSNVYFVWVLRPRTVLDGDDDLLPLGYEKEVCGRGIVVPWTNQIAVISHPAVGGFLTHCGWNSILESIWYKIPMLCFPVFGDQFTNRKLVVEDWRVGINLCNEKPITRVEIAAQIKNFMSQKSRNELRGNINGARKILENALGANGSSEKYIDLVIEKLKKQNMKSSSFSVLKA